jgi:hypothetical protein
MPIESKLRSSSQTWATFLKNQVGAKWACDFTVAYDWMFRTWYIFVILKQKTRRIIHIGGTQSPTDKWTAQQLREATPQGKGPKYLNRDGDSKYATHFSVLAAGPGIKELRTPYRVPQANGICERFMGSLRRECLDHTLIYEDRHLERVVKEYMTFFNQERPHQGIGQRIPSLYDRRESKSTSGRITSVAILDGLHRSYSRAPHLNYPLLFLQNLTNQSEEYLSISGCVVELHWFSCEWWIFPKRRSFRCIPQGGMGPSSTKYLRKTP